MNPAVPDPHALPLLFWVGLTLIGLLMLVSWHYRRAAWGMPSLVVHATVFTWYLGDILYGGFADIRRLFQPDIIDLALGQVCLFAVAYAALTPEVSRWFTRRLAPPEPAPAGSDPFADETRRRDVATTLAFVAAIWGVLVFVGLYRGGFPWLAVFAPPLAGYRHDMWERARLGTGTDFLLAAASYLHVFLTALFGVAFMLARRLRTRIAAAIMAALAWPYFLFASTRNTILAIGVPSLFAYALYGRQRPWVKVATILALFMVANVWFRFVVAARDRGVVESLVAVVEGSASADWVKQQRHLGLDMYRELCYLNTYIRDGRYAITWGGRYFAEAVNIVPRTLWPGKPTIGIDYARARGAVTRGWGGQLVNVTVSTGMIGQGVANFGGFLGPVAAAFLMAVWSGILARFWMQRRSVIRLSLFLVGLGLTFNAGRDITLLVFFPFLFGYLMALIREHRPASTDARDSALIR